MEEKYDINIEHLKTLDSWADLDREFTAKVHSRFGCPAEYYYQASCLLKLTKIKVPTLCLSSRDDPVLPFDLVPMDECKANENIITAVTPHGAHCCYFMDPKGDKRWSNYACAEFLTQVTNNKNKNQ